MNMIHPAALDAVAGSWHVLHTKSRQEKALASTLAAMDVPFYLPLIRKVQYYGRRKCTINVPLFPSYVFLRGSIEKAYEADRTKRVARIITVADQERIDRELKNLHQALSQEAPLDPYPHLREGIWVEVRSGPFQGIQGLIEQRTKNDRLILQIDVLGQASSLEIDGALLEPLE